MPLTILNGSTFCVCDDHGDIDAPTAGLFAEDTRLLSRCILRINGELPLFLSALREEAYSAAFFLRNPVVRTKGLSPDSLATGVGQARIRRTRGAEIRE